ncbi:MAG TPA: TIM barrel protein [Bacillota bacterium]|nr:TIM barrel protein [Bacillota bacterium]
MAAERGAMDIRERLYVATMADDAVQIAEEYGIGLEIDEFCTAANMDAENFDLVDRSARKKMEGASRHIFHAPFNELFPSAIDPMALRLAYQRLNQAYELAKQYGISRMVVHSGYVPYVYFKSWFLERSVEFWRTFMADKPEDFHIMIENVLEDEPHTLAKLIGAIGDRRVRACLDIGHANCTTSLDLMEWVRALGPCLSHVHIHNNCREYDNHDPLGRGDIDMDLILKGLMQHAAAGATYTIENLKCADSLKWLSENGWI